MLPRTLDARDAFPSTNTQDWRSLVEQDLAGAPFERKLVTHTYEGIYVQPLYTAADWANTTDASGFSGFAPFTRGSIPLDHQRSGWDIRQQQDAPDADSLNATILDDLAGGATSILLRLDAASRAGLDPDDPAATALAGVDGAMISSIDDLRAALRGVHLDMIAIALESGAAFLPAAAQLAALWHDANLAPEECRGAFNADPLAVLARDGQLPVALDDALGHAADLAAWTAHRYPHVTAIRVGSAPYHHAGATATQDLAFSMATALEYLRAMTRAGMSVDAAASQLLFSYAVGTHQFLAIAKLRAARRLWGSIAHTCGISAANARMKMHVRPSKRVLAARDPWVNILRNSVCVLAAGLAGADTIGSEPFDAALVATRPDARSSMLARRIARNTHLILQEECHLHRVVDAPGGSWYLERLTDELVEKAWIILQAIEARGGMRVCLEDGWIAAQIDSAAQPRWRDIATRKEALLGVSEFASVAEQRPEPPLNDLAILRRKAIERVRVQRADASVLAALRAAQSEAARGLEASRPGALTAQAFTLARAGATLGQLATHIASLSLGNTPTASISAMTPHPFGEVFEQLRNATDEYAVACGQRPRVALVSVGTPADHLARTNYARGFFEAGGFDVKTTDGGTDPATLTAAFAASGASIAVICSSDAKYAEFVGTLAPKLHAAGARTVVLAGNPGPNEAAYRDAGVDRFIFVRCDVVKTLRELLEQEGVAL
ncbi:MAG: methylmalonyl-CoA mutase family protein [Planctomycetota bacterium]|nr:methylmalonyl-CoA mutase family protein [Planctomycetota bacterium]